MNPLIVLLRLFFRWLGRSVPTSKNLPQPKPPVDYEDNYLPSVIQDAQEVAEKDVIVRDCQDFILNQTPKPTFNKRYCWCLDNGHGALQPGKRSVVFDDGKTQFLEWEFNYDIVERIRKELFRLGIDYFVVVPDAEGKGSFLKGRVERANSFESFLPKIYLSIHANAGPTGKDGWGSATGIETWHHKDSFEGVHIAAIFQQHLVKKIGWRNRGLKSSKLKDLYVLRATEMPAVLTENGFFTNKYQAHALMDDRIRQDIADAHVAAILQIERTGF